MRMRYTEYIQDIHINVYTTYTRDIHKINDGGTISLLSNHEFLVKDI